MTMGQLHDTKRLREIGTATRNGPDALGMRAMGNFQDKMSVFLGGINVVASNGDIGRDHIMLEETVGRTTREARDISAGAIRRKSIQIESHASSCAFSMVVQMNFRDAEPSC